MYAKLNPLQIGLPQNAQKKDGTWVSNYHLLPADILTKEGWLTAEEVKPVCTETQTLVLDMAVQMKGRIVLTYKAVDIPPDPLQVAQAELDKYKQAVAEVVSINTATALKTTLVDAVNRLKTAVEVKTEPIVKEIVK